MPKRAHMRTLLIFLSALMAASATWMLFRESPDQGLLFGTNPDLPTLTLYTTGLATTAQMPFWTGIQSGEILRKCNIRVHVWKNTDDLRGLLLAGKGDLWLGHTEGFAQAHALNAPVQMLLVSGWRKFYLISRNPTLHALADLSDHELAHAPPGSPGVSVLKALLTKEEANIRFRGLEPRQLALMLLEGKIDSALVPEPLLTSLLLKDPNLFIIANLEDIYGERTQGPRRMPLAGMAVNRHTAVRHPEIIAHILAVVEAEGKGLREDPLAGVDALPEAFSAFIPKEMVRASLVRDLVHVESAWAAREEVLRYLNILMPGWAQGPAAWDTFFWKSTGEKG